MKKIILERGQKFGRWTVVEPATSLRGDSRYICLCDCGTLRPVLTSKLTRETSKSCGCVGDAALANKRWTGYGELSGTHWKSILRAATERALAVDITIEQAWLLFQQQRSLCAITGLPIEMNAGRNNRGSKSTASLDRIDSTRGYTVDNVHWVHKHINKMKMEFPLPYFIDMCRLVVDQSVKKEGSI